MKPETVLDILIILVLAFLFNVLLASFHVPLMIGLLLSLVAGVIIGNVVANWRSQQDG